MERLAEVHMDRISIIEQIRSSEKLFSLPQVLSETLKEVGKENFSADSLARIILKDPSLTSRVLRVANSAFYQRLAKTTTINQAVAVLGVTTVKCLALSSSIFQPEKIAEESGVDPKAFFAYVLSVAAASEKIAKTIGAKAPEEAFIAGLLHDVGVLFFLHHFPNEYHRIIDKRVKARTLMQAEVEVFGIDHCEVGSHLAKVWRLPDYIVRSIAEHHVLKNVNENNVIENIVRLAVFLASDRFSGYEMGPQERMMNIRKLRTQLSLSKNQIDDISYSLLSGAINTANYLGIDIGDTQEILMKANEEIWKSFLTIENLFKERQELSKKLLEEERAKGAIESQNTAIATLSHYLNNAVMAIYGRSQLMRRLIKKGDTDKLLEQLPNDLEMIDKSVQKIVAVLEEMKEISPIDQLKFNDMSAALNIDDRIEKRLQKIHQESAQTHLNIGKPAQETITS